MGDADDGPTFGQRVEAVVAGLPAGALVTYGDVAREAGSPGAARAVGTALRRTDAPVPWWRVVPASGRLAAHLADRQADHLRAEGVVVVDGRIVADAGRGGGPGDDGPGGG